MPHGKRTCPICAGTGVVKEDANQYEFVTRDPITSKCMICNGTGEVGTNKKLPNGKHVNSLRPTLREKLGMEEKRQDDASTMSKRLNVSKKAMVPDTGLGYKQNLTQILADQGADNPSGEDRPDDVRWWLKRQGEICKLREEIELVIKHEKGWVFISSDDPIYLEVFKMYRKQRKSEGKWTEEDEHLYVVYCEDQIELLKEAING